MFYTIYIDKFGKKILGAGEQKKVEAGDFPITGYAEDGSVIVDDIQYSAKFIPGNQWWIDSHNSTQQEQNF